MQKTLHTLSELENEAQILGNSLKPEGEQATLITLSGELGAGKTAFTKALAQAFGVEDTVTSPTFVLEKIYTLPKTETFKRLIHIDAYRLKEGKELSALGFDEALQDPGNLIVLEWPERVQGALPKADIAITLAVQEDGSRALTYIHD